MGLKAVAANATPAANVTVGTSVVANGADTQVLYQDGTTIGESSSFTFAKASGTLTATVSKATTTLAVGAGVAAGGSLTAGVTLATAATLGLFYGSGAPSLAAAQGSIYLRTDATGATSRLYVQGAAATAASWINVTMAA